MAERQNALVTGSANGLGLFIAQALHAAGYRVALSDRDGAAAERAARELDPSGDSTLGLALDVVSKSAFEQAADALAARWGQLHVAVNNAAVTVTPSVIVAAGTISKTFTITTTPVAVDTVVTISARQGTTTVTAPLTVQAPALSSLTFASTSITQGGTQTGTVRLNGAAPAGGVVVASRRVP